MARSAVHGKALVVLTVITAVLFGIPTAARAQPRLPAGDPVVVSLGDSYISGTGARWAGNSDDFLFDRGGTDRAWSRPKGKLFGSSDPAKIYGATAKTGCYRSDSAPINSAVAKGLSLGRPVNLACSGARAANVLRASEGGVGMRGEQPQNDQLAALARTSRVKLVVLSIGGNDLSFPDLVFRCITAYALRNDPCKTKQQPRLDVERPAMGAAVGEVLDDIRATLAGAGYRDGDYRLILQSYPNPLPSASEDKYEGYQRAFKWTGGRCPFTDPDMTWTARQVTPSIAATLKRTAHRHGATFLDLSNAFDGHELCAEGTRHPKGDPVSAAVEWVRFVDYTGQGDYAESLHPNFYGQQAIGICLAGAARITGDSACSGTPGRGLRGLRVR
ncbi:GDSL-type esterase/lipase family protein [Kineosporia mesophila]|nr:GDSL-type esterase/lipase family protein [Kineosporia mesophila]MCD5350394.1 GDSL-type esterase/lipase family protein [Kineosporia mesophila]